MFWFCFNNLVLRLSATLWRDVPFSAIYWLVVEEVKKKQRDRAATQVVNKTNQFVTSLTAASAGGLTAAMVTHPFDVIKTKRQVFEFANVPVRGTWDIARMIVQTDGWRGLAVGLAPRLAKVIPGASIMLTTYDVGKLFFEEKHFLDGRS